MDDTDALRIAMDCTAADTDMLDSDDRDIAEVSAPPVSADLSLAPPVDDDAPEPEDDRDEAFAQALETPALPEPDGDARQRQIIEALLFSSDAPLSAGRLAAMLEGCSVTKVRLLIADLNDRYRDAGLSFRIESIARGYQMMTQPEFQPWIARLHKQRSETRLSAAAMETLSIVAYKQPVIRADVEAIRGVACGEVLSRLRDMGLVRVLGRAEIVGRPLLYGTTKKFLDVFGLADLDDLPPLEALSLRPRSKPIEEVEPVAPPAIPEPPPTETKEPTADSPATRQDADAEHDGGQPPPAGHPPVTDRCHRNTIGDQPPSAGPSTGCKPVPQDAGDPLPDGRGSAGKPTGETPVPPEAGHDSLAGGQPPAAGHPPVTNRCHRNTIGDQPPSAGRDADAEDDGGQPPSAGRAADTPVLAAPTAIGA